ncbi:unnamed protein product [Sphenostylis stenocarpa]|uniref:Prolamin-like domain-containing protein n=1 Tax=Sphenostylis stenocarpa TaxID=92480 RepID=A0AA87B905_9FABA|nr:unnamed protein product [Sphenostylis stenocarpa]
MATLSNYLILVAFLLATAIETISATEEQESLFECRRHMNSHCGNKIVDVLSSQKKNKVSRECCYKIVQMGYSCHSRLTLFVSQTNAELRSKNSTHVMAKNDVIFNKCDQATKPESWQYLSNCVVKIGAKCGKQIFEKQVDSKHKVTKHCCQKLVKMGESCHINLAKALIRTPEMRDVDAIQFLHNSKKIFDQCRDLE